MSTHPDVRPVGVIADSPSSSWYHHAETLAVRERLRLGMGRSALSSALTPFDETGEVDFEAFRVHVKTQIAARPGAIFVCCVAGEFFSLSLTEYEELVNVAVEVSDGQVPVVAGIGYSWAMAVDFARAAVRAGADAGLLLPHDRSPDEGYRIVEEILEITARTVLPILLCERGPVFVSGPTTEVLKEIPTLIGIQDCHGDVGYARWMRSMAPSDWVFCNGASSAEVNARVYAEVGVPTYASPVHAFAPEVSGAFFRALQEGDDDRVDELLRSFFLPLQTLLSKGPGYEVSVPKAAARLRGAPMGPVRAPLVNPSREHLRELEDLVHRGLAVAVSG